MDYQFKDIEKKWQGFWADKKPFKPENNSIKPKYYILDMFPYPSGAGLHVGHPLGYIASDILSRYKRLQGFNVLHPMGYDSFGLPAEQYAIQTGQHPAITTVQNIETYRRQLDQLGFSFDWDSEVRTSDPNFYKWTQWIFIQLFNSYYNIIKNKAEKIEILIHHLEKFGTENLSAVASADLNFTAVEWKSFSENKKEEILLNYRLAYTDETMVNWCPGLGTVLANEEVKEGFSERGGFPVERKLMKQWSLRITAYADRLLNDLEKIDWPEPVKEMQRNWIGKSVGSSIQFEIENSNEKIEVFSTRPDTIFGCSFIVLAPENPLVLSLTSTTQKEKVLDYQLIAKNKSERDRMADVKNISGTFIGAYAIHPFTKEKLPIWIADYVLAGYGTGAVMAVPAHDSRDYAFANFYNLPIKEVVAGGNIELESYEAKEGILINSDFLNGLEVKTAIKNIIEKLEALNIGKGKTQFRLRDAGFSRQRYWGEPFPVYYKDGLPKMISEKELPLVLPEVDKYLPTKDGEPPLARAENWNYNGMPLETNTMPGWAGSSWYFLRYMDAHNDTEFVSKKAVDYWQQIDVYLGGAEHATGHLLYVRFWTKFLFDLGCIPFDEPAKKLINQGMITGESQKIFLEIRNTNWTDIAGEILLDSPFSININFKSNAGNDKNIEIKDISALSNIFYSAEILGNFPEKNFIENYVDIKLTKKTNYSHNILEINQNPDDVFLKTHIFIEKNGYWQNGIFNQILEGPSVFLIKPEIEKMSKSKWNVVNPDNIISDYGADTLRMYEMFLGPLEQSKPWNTNGIEGVFKFLRKFWKLFHNDQFNFSLSDAEPTKEELKALHKIIKKVEEDIERFSFNTSISAFMICVNELGALKCNNRKILTDLTIVLSPFAPHICEEIWELLGLEKGSLSYVSYPKWKEEFLIESNFDYPISFNGKVRTKISLSLSMDAKKVEDFVLMDAEVQKYLNGQLPKKVIVVHGRIVNMVV